MISAARAAAQSPACGYNLGNEKLSYAFSIWRMEGDWNL